MIYDLAHVAGWEPYNLHDLGHASYRLDLYYTDPAQHIVAGGYNLDDLVIDVSDQSFRRVQRLSQ